MLYQDMLKLAAINSNNAKLAELSKQLSPDEWINKKFANKKLSKHLLSIGLDNKTTSELLSATVNDTMTRVVSDMDTCLNQGNSIYYASCQSTDKRSKNGEHNISDTSIEGDILHLGKTLFFWVAGNSMSVDGKGFTARAKLRIMYTDNNCNEVFGLWLEKIYGNALLLMSNFQTLVDWWGTDTPIYRRGNRENTSIYIPSARNGYQDTASERCSYYEVVNNESLLKQAYKFRPRNGGVRQIGLDKVKFNPQNCEFVAPKLEDKSYRGLITKELRKKLDYIITTFGYPKSSRLSIDSYSTRFDLQYKDNAVYVRFCPYDYQIYIDDFCILSVDYDYNTTRVIHNYGEFQQAVYIPYRRREDKLIVIDDNLEAGFAEAWDINGYIYNLDEFMERYESINRVD